MVSGGAVLETLAHAGVVLTLEDGRLKSRAPKGALTPELAALIREHKADVLAHLSARQDFAPLPEPLARMVQAAKGTSLDHPALLEGIGRVPNLGMYILACAASYACGWDSAHELRRLWACHAAWSI